MPRDQWKDSMPSSHTHHQASAGGAGRGTHRSASLNIKMTEARQHVRKAVLTAEELVARNRGEVPGRPSRLHLVGGGTPAGLRGGISGREHGVCPEDRQAPELGPPPQAVVNKWELVRQSMNAWVREHARGAPAHRLHGRHASEQDAKSTGGEQPPEPEEPRVGLGA